MKREPQEYSWIVEEFKGRTRPTNKHPAGLERWVDVDAPGRFRTRRLDKAMKLAKARRERNRQLSEMVPPHLRSVVSFSSTFRLRNLRTHDIIMSDVV